MAGDWVKLEVTTPDKPEIVRMAADLRIDQDAVVGKLLRVWVWADQNSVDGEGVTITAAFIDRLTSRKGFAAAMRAAGWLIGDDGALTFPNFDRHNGATGKARSETNRRVRKHRECNAPTVTKPLQKPLPEKRREEEEKNTDHLPAIPAAHPSPAAGDATEVRTLVVLPTLDQAKAFAPTAGVPPDIAETWWNECEARPLSPTGHFTDRDGNAIRKWQASLTAYGRKWQSNDLQRRRPASPSRHSAAPIHQPGDDQL